jgi:hypothetical protein
MSDVYNHWRRDSSGYIRKCETEKENSDTRQKQVKEIVTKL